MCYGLRDLRQTDCRFLLCARMSSFLFCCGAHTLSFSHHFFPPAPTVSPAPSWMLAMAGILRRSDAAAAGDGIRAKSHASLHHGPAEVESILPCLLLILFSLLVIDVALCCNLRPDGYTQSCRLHINLPLELTVHCAVTNVQNRVVVPQLLTANLRVRADCDDLLQAPRAGARAYATGGM